MDILRRHSVFFPRVVPGFPLHAENFGLMSCSSGNSVVKEAVREASKTFQRLHGSGGSYSLRQVKQSTKRFGLCVCPLPTASSGFSPGLTRFSTFLMDSSSTSREIFAWLLGLTSPPFDVT